MEPSSPLETPSSAMGDASVPISNEEEQEPLTAADEAPTIADMGLQAGDRPKPRLRYSLGSLLSALVVPFLLAVVLVLAVSLIVRLLRLYPLTLSPQSVLLLPHVFPSWASSPSVSVGATRLVPSPFDPSQSVHPDVAYLLQQAHNDTPFIPDILHFVIGTTHTASSSSSSSPSFPAVSSSPVFHLQHWLALKSAAEVIQPSAIYCHVVTPPTSPWWSKASPFCTRILPTRALSHIFGRPVHHRQTKSDILRLEALLQWGGVALDLDTLTTASWKADPAQYALFFKLDLLLALTQSATKNWADRYDASWVAARPGAPLLREWYGAYRMYEGEGEVVRQGVVEGSADTAWAEYDDRVPAYSHALLWTLSVLRPHLHTSLQPQMAGLPYAWEEEGRRTLYGEEGGNVKAPGGWTVHLWQDEREVRRVSTTKDGVVVEVEGVVEEEVSAMYRVDDELQVCALATRSMYGRLLLQAMNGYTEAYPCPKG